MDSRKFTFSEQGASHQIRRLLMFEVHQREIETVKICQV